MKLQRVIACTLYSNTVVTVRTLCFKSCEDKINEGDRNKKLKCAMKKKTAKEDVHFMSPTTHFLKW